VDNFEKPFESWSKLPALESLVLRAGEGRTMEVALTWVFQFCPEMRELHLDFEEQHGGFSDSFGPLRQLPKLQTFSLRFAFQESPDWVAQAVRAVAGVVTSLTLHCENATGSTELGINAVYAAVAQCTKVRSLALLGLALSDFGVQSLAANESLQTVAFGQIFDVFRRTDAGSTMEGILLLCDLPQRIGVRVTASVLTCILSMDEDEHDEIAQKLSPRLVVTATRQCPAPALQELRPLLPRAAFVADADADVLSELGRAWHGITCPCERAEEARLDPDSEESEEEEG
jgi:hypothetical protein